MTVIDAGDPVVILAGIHVGHVHPLLFNPNAGGEPRPKAEAKRNL
jgi:hypothetical protein